MTPVFSLDLFCSVVDNFGDAGVCWRLARQLAKEYPLKVRLWIDRLATLEKICPEARVNQAEQLVSGVTVLHWPESFPEVDPASVPDIVVEGFGCRLPDNYVSAMATRKSPPLWINMEYLSAESWVDDCHGMASPHPSFSLTKYFLFPGFSAQTGGLVREADLIERRRLFQQDEANKQAFLRQLGVDAVASHTLSLFCYEDAPVSVLFDMLARQKGGAVLCLVPEGVAGTSVSAFLGQPARAGAKQTEGALTVQVIPFMDQDDYDRLLWACDLNFVRGEDSFVRAQWAARPFVWHIYPQDEAAHLTKLHAFLGAYLSGMPVEEAETVRKGWLAWNGERESDADLADSWQEMCFRMLPALAEYGGEWGDELAGREDFASSLFRFINSMR